MVIDASSVAVKTKKPSEISLKERKEMSRLHLPAGALWPVFQSHACDDDRVILAKHQDHIVGWALLLRHPGDRKTPEIMMYVASRYRRKGIGTAVLGRANMIAKRWGQGRVKSWQWDGVSGYFYESCRDKGMNIQVCSWHRGTGSYRRRRWILE
jgi:GNAT superfamily N-acetyltransferase